MWFLYLKKEQIAGVKTALKIKDIKAE